jgi:hypothetical protein
MVTCGLGPVKCFRFTGTPRRGDSGVGWNGVPFLPNNLQVGFVLVPDLRDIIGKA